MSEFSNGKITKQQKLRFNLVHILFYFFQFLKIFQELIQACPLVF